MKNRHLKPLAILFPLALASCQMEEGTILKELEQQQKPPAEEIRGEVGSTSSPATQTPTLEDKETSTAVIPQQP